SPYGVMLPYSTCDPPSPTKTIRPAKAGSQALAACLLGPLPDRHRCPAVTRFCVGRLPFIRRDSCDGAFLSGVPEVRENVAIHLQHDGFVRFIDRPGTEIGGGSMHHRL